MSHAPSMQGGSSNAAACNATGQLKAMRRIHAHQHVAAIEDRRIVEADLSETEAYAAGESELIAFGGDDSEEEERRATQARPAKAVTHAVPPIFHLCVPHP